MSNTEKTPIKKHQSHSPISDDKTGLIDREIIIIISKTRGQY